MKRLITFLTLFVFLAPALDAQPKVVHYKKMQELLPTKEIKGFKRNKPTGQTQTAMGMTVSEAGVKYVKPVEDESGESQYIEVKISDITMIPFAAMAFAFDQGDFENETEDGYEKSTVVKKKYRAREEARTGDYKSCKLNLHLANRFLVSLEAYGIDDAKILHELAESIELAKLEALTP